MIHRGQKEALSILHDQKVNKIANTIDRRSATHPV